MHKAYYNPKNGPVDGDNPAIFEELPVEIQQQLMDWIKAHFDPARPNVRAASFVPTTSYGYKHIFTRETGIYITNGHFKGAILAAGLRVAKLSAQNWKVKARYIPTA